jgi:hypothetical protein
VKGPKWVLDKKYDNTWHSRYGEMVEYYNSPACDIRPGWYYWSCGALVARGPFKTRQLAQKCGDRPKPKRRK